MRHGLYEKRWWGLGSDPALFAVQPRLSSGGLPQYRGARVQVWQLGQSNFWSIFFPFKYEFVYREDIFHSSSVQKLYLMEVSRALCVASGPELERNKATSDVRTKHGDPSTLLRKTEQTFIALKYKAHLFP